MKILVVALVLIRWATAADGDPLKDAQQEARVSRIETLDLKEQLLTKQFEAIHAEKMALYAEACKAAGLPVDPKVCAVDFATRTVNKQPPAPEKK